MSLTKLVENLMKERKRNEKEIEKEMNVIKAKLNKPDLSGFIVINLRTGKTRKPKVGEFRPLLIDYSDPSPMDGDLILPEERKGVKKHGKKK
jgi:hypothetical protein